MTVAGKWDLCESLKLWRLSSGFAGRIPIALLLWLVLVTTLKAQAIPGTIPGAFSVSKQGVGQYTIPIATPAATGGLQPSLALTYNVSDYFAASFPAAGTADIRRRRPAR